MAAEVVRVEGIRELSRSLRQFEGDLGKAPRLINKDAAKLVAEKGRAIAPHRSGRLASSIRPGATGASAYVQSRLIYSGVIHFGWPGHSISPNPYLYKALDARRDEVIRLYQERIAKLAGEVRGR